MEELLKETVAELRDSEACLATVARVYVAFGPKGGGGGFIPITEKDPVQMAVAGQTIDHVRFQTSDGNAPNIKHARAIYTTIINGTKTHNRLAITGTVEDDPTADPPIFRTSFQSFTINPTEVIIVEIYFGNREHGQEGTQRSTWVFVGQ